MSARPLGFGSGDGTGTGTPSTPATLDIGSFPAGGLGQGDDRFVAERSGSNISLYGSDLPGVALGHEPNVFGVTAFDGRNPDPTRDLPAYSRTQATATRDAYVAQVAVWDSLTGTDDWYFGTSSNDNSNSIAIWRSGIYATTAPWGSAPAWVIPAGSTVQWSGTRRTTSADASATWVRATGRVFITVDFSDNDPSNIVAWVANLVCTVTPLGHDWMTHYADDPEKLIVLSHHDFGTTPTLHAGEKMSLANYRERSWAGNNAGVRDWRLKGNAVTWQEILDLSGGNTDTLRYAAEATNDYAPPAGSLIAIVTDPGEWIVLRLDTIAIAPRSIDSGSAIIHVYRVTYILGHTAETDYSAVWVENGHASRSSGEIGTVIDSLHFTVQASAAGMAWATMGVTSGVSAAVIQGLINVAAARKQDTLPTLGAGQAWRGAVSTGAPTPVDWPTALQEAIDDTLEREQVHWYIRRSV